MQPTAPHSPASPSLHADDGVHCHRHLGRMATGHCSRCSLSICEDCTTYDGGGLFCAACNAQYRDARWKRMYALSAGIVVVVGAMFAMDAAFEKEQMRDRYGPLADVAEERLAQAPCDASAVVTLARAMRKGADHEGILERTAKHLDRCGDDGAVRLEHARAALALNHNDLAMADAEHLVTTESDNAEGYAMRAAVHERKKEPGPALMDHRQAVLLDPLRENSVKRQQSLHIQFGDACGAVTPVLVENDFRKDPSFTASTRARFIREKCGNVATGGEAELNALSTFTAMMNALEVRTAIEPRSVMTLVSVDTARSLGLELEMDRVRAWHPSGVLEGRLARVNVVKAGDAWAYNVDVLVVDALPGGLDVVLGSSFFARFSVDRSSFPVLMLRAPAP